MCAIDWGFIAAWIGALATVGILVAAIYGFGEWKLQFLKTRDHDLARRILKAIGDSHLVFDELRTPHALFSDADEAVALPTVDDLPGQFEHRKMHARYKARSRHLANVRQERTALLFEAKALWDDGGYAVRLGALINQLAPLEESVLDEATKYVDNLAPGPEEDLRVNRSILYRPLDPNSPDPTDDEYVAATKENSDHVKQKIRME